MKFILDDDVYLEKNISILTLSNIITMFQILGEILNMQF